MINELDLETLAGRACDCGRRRIRRDDPKLEQVGDVETRTFVDLTIRAERTVATCCVRCTVCQHVAKVATERSVAIVTQLGTRV